MMDRPFSQLILRCHLPLLCAAMACYGCGGPAETPNAAGASVKVDNHASDDAAQLHYPAAALSQPALLKPVSYTFPLPPNPAGRNDYQPRVRATSEVQIGDQIVSLVQEGDGFVIEVSPPMPSIVRLPAVEEQRARATPARTRILPPVDSPMREEAKAPAIPTVSTINEDTDAIDSTTTTETTTTDLPRRSRWSSEEVAPVWIETPAEQQQIAVGEDHRDSIQRLPHAPPAEAATRRPPVSEEPVVEEALPEVTPEQSLSGDDPHLDTMEQLPLTSAAEEQSDAAEPSATEDVVVAEQAVEEFIPAIDPMRAVNQRAEAMIRHGFSLAQRGATYSAQVELIEAMRIVAEALDLRDNTRRHSDALKRGFRAIEEAKDFQQRGLAADLDMHVLVAGHQTPVLKDWDLTSVTPLVGLQQYFTFAQEQLSIAGGEQATSSVALYGIGRLQGEMQAGEQMASPQAIVFHQAAVMVDGMNYKAANELGVLLAQYGQFEQARELLAHSVRVCPHVESWRNLAKVHQRLGEHDLARRAAHQSHLAATQRTRRGGNGDASVRWVDPGALAGTIGPAEQSDVGRTVNPSPATPTTNENSPTRNVSRGTSEGIMRLIPWMRRGE